MAHYDLEEQEQLDSLKTWWKMYGNLLTSLLLAASLAVIGWQAWNWYQNGQAAKAAAVYGALEQALQSGDAQRIKAAAGELTEKHASTHHALLGAMQAAQFSFSSGDLKTAKAQLNWVVDNGKDEIRDLARLRLAAILLDDQAYDTASGVLGGGFPPAFAVRQQELLGDIHAAQGKKSEAKAAYRSALEKSVDKPGAGRELLQQKLDALGEAA